MKLTKKFTQGNFYIGGGNYEWKDINETYEQAKKRLATFGPLYDEVREVEKTFDAETFEITIKVLKITVRTYDKVYHSWHGDTAETIYEE